MYTNHTNPIALENQDKITRALLELMRQKPFDRVTVTEICRAAGLERMTFYRHFDEKVDVIRYYLDREMTRLLSSLPHQSTLERNLTALFVWAQTERQGLSALMDNHMTTLITQSLHQSIFSLLSANLSEADRRHMPASPYSGSDPYINGAVMGTVLGMITVWRMDDYRETPGELALRCLAIFGLFPKKAETSQ